MPAALEEVRGVNFFDQRKSKSPRDPSTRKKIKIRTLVDKIGSETSSGALQSDCLRNVVGKLDELVGKPREFLPELMDPSTPWEVAYRARSNGWSNDKNFGALLPNC